MLKSGMGLGEEPKINGLKDSRQDLELPTPPSTAEKLKDGNDRTLNKLLDNSQNSAVDVAENGHENIGKRNENDRQLPVTEFDNEVKSTVESETRNFLSRYTVD
jgi:alpha-tubulin suppressor-like RCC1 family protein